MAFTLSKDRYGSPRWSAEITDCALPMTFDTYSNCGFQCAYCFSQNQRSLRTTRYSERTEVCAVDVERIKRLFLGDPTVVTRPEGERGFERGGLWQFWPFIKQRRMMQWGGLSDPFCTLEKQFGIGLDLLRFFREIEYPISFSTKGTWFLDDPRYVDVIKGAPNWHFKVSIITGDKGKAARIERGVRSPAERLRAIERLSGLLGHDRAVTLRMRPFIVGVTNPTHQQLIRDAGAAGAASVSTEFLCMEQRLPDKSNYDRISKECGFDIFDFYRRHTPNATGYMRLNRSLKSQYVEEIKATAHECGMTVHISDAHFKEHGDSGCCCGMDNSWPWSRGQLCEAMQVARRTGRVTWQDMEAELGYAAEFGYAYASGFNTRSVEQRAKFHGRTMKDYLRTNWNNTKRNSGPYRAYGGVLVPVERDANGDLVYEMNGGKPL